MAGPATESGSYEEETSKTAAPGIDRILFGACVIVIVGACVPMALFPEQASVVVTASWVIIANLMVDLSYTYLDPRVREATV